MFHTAQKFRLTALHVGVPALARCAVTDTGYCFLPTGRDVPNIFDTRDRRGLAVPAAALWWVCEQVVDHPPDERHADRLTGDLGGVKHVNGNQVVGIGHAHSRQCATAITAGGAATPANTLAVWCTGVVGEALPTGFRSGRRPDRPRQQFRWPRG
jgi:hypothetical protein